MTSKLDEIKHRLAAYDAAQEAAKPHYVTYMNTTTLPDMYGYPIASARQAIAANAPDDLRALLTVVEAAVELLNVTNDSTVSLGSSDPTCLFCQGELDSRWVFVHEADCAFTKFKQAVAALTGSDSGEGG